MKLLTNPNGSTKTNKALAFGYANYILHLAPADMSGRNVCPAASNGCRAACLNYSGRGQWFKNKDGLNPIHAARIYKTNYWFNERAEFLGKLRHEVRLAIKRETARGYTPVFRLNGTSDIRFENYGIFEKFPEVQFYDYTKLSNRRNLPANYKLTFSRSEINDSEIPAAFRNGMNVAAVFRDQLPAKYNGRRVIDGDKHDLRFLDPPGVYVGLAAKGSRGKKDKTGFIIDIKNRDKS